MQHLVSGIGSGGRGHVLQPGGPLLQRPAGCLEMPVQDHDLLTRGVDVQHQRDRLGVVLFFRRSEQQSDTPVTH